MYYTSNALIFSGTGYPWALHNNVCRYSQKEEIDYFPDDTMTVDNEWPIQVPLYSPWCFNINNEPVECEVFPCGCKLLDDFSRKYRMFFWSFSVVY